MNLEKQSQIKTLIARGKEKGYLTYAEATDHLPEIVDSEQLDDVISMINSMGIVVHDEAPDEESLLMPEPTAAATDEDEDEIEEAAAQVAALDDQFGSTTEPLKPSVTSKASHSWKRSASSRRTSARTTSSTFTSRSCRSCRPPPS